MWVSVPANTWSILMQHPFFMYLSTCGTYTCVRQARRGCSLSCSIILCLDLLGQGLSLSLDLGWQPTSPRNLPASARCGAGVTDMSIHARDLNSGPYADLASTFLLSHFSSSVTLALSVGTSFWIGFLVAVVQRLHFFSVTFLLSLWIFHKCVQCPWSYPQLPSFCPDLSKAHALTSSLLLAPWFESVLKFMQHSEFIRDVSCTVSGGQCTMSSWSKHR